MDQANLSPLESDTPPANMSETLPGLVIESWNTACARLHQSFGPNAQKGGRSDRAGTDILPTDLPGLQDWADSLLSVDAAEDVVRQAWPRLEEGDRQQRWDYFMMRTLQHYPSQGLKVLKATYTSPLPPAPRVGDVLQFLCGYHLLDGDLRSRRKVTDKLLETIYFVLTQGNGRLAEIDQKTIYLLFTRLNLERAHRLYEKLGHHGMSVRPHTLLHLIDLTAKSGSSGAVARASQLLDDVLAKEDSPLVSSQILAVSSTILSKLGTSAEGHDLHPQILASLVSRGVQPDITLVNNVLRSTLSAGNPEIGWRIYDMLGQYGMKADRYTFSILINDAKRRRDWEALERIVRTAREQGLALDEHLVNDLIHAASQSANTVTNTKADAALPTRSRRAVRAEQRKALRACWGTTLEYYRSFYSLQPLYDLGVLHHKNNPTVSSSTADSRSDSSPSTTPKPMPPAPTLNLILSNYIITRRSLEGIKRVYCRYRALASGRHEHLVALYESDWVSHAFITAFSRREETLPLCAEILDDMLKASGGNPPRTGHNAPTRTRGPTIKTLLILLRTYTDPPPYHPTPKPSSLTSPTSATPLTDAKLIRTLPSASHLAKAESILSLLTNMDPPSPPSSSSSFSSSPPQTFHPTPHDLQRAYNLLLAGYVRVRDRPGAMSVLRRMEGHGLGGDKGTVAILTRSGEGAEVVRLMREGGRGFGWGGGGLKFDEMGWDGGKDGTVMALLERNSS
ncbi:MAG: hypothetical protein M1817_006078 [Caeruleum heppii]|nr:MAG: hypothetical protein M1817_006078 [Caeruleum heppii]